MGVAVASSSAATAFLPARSEGEGEHDSGANRPQGGNDPGHGMEWNEEADGEPLTTDRELPTTHS